MWTVKFFEGEETEKVIDALMKLFTLQISLPMLFWWFRRTLMNPFSQKTMISKRWNKIVLLVNLRNTFLSISAVDKLFAANVNLTSENRNASSVNMIGLLRIKQGNSFNNCNQDYPSVMFLLPKSLIDKYCMLLKYWYSNSYIGFFIWAMQVSCIIVFLNLNLIYILQKFIIIIIVYIKSHD